MPTLPADTTVRRVQYDAQGLARTAHLRKPATEQGSTLGTVVVCTGTAILGLDPNQPAVEGLETLACELENGLLDAGYGVVRPEPCPPTSASTEELLSTSASLLQAAFAAGGPGGRRVVIGFSAAAPLLAIAASEKPLDVMILIAPPILEVYANRPDRVETTLATELGLDAETAAGLGDLKPLSRAANATPRALVVHGAADAVVSCEDSIGWRASLAAAGTNARRLEIAFAGHDLGPASCRSAAVEAMVRFIAEES
ncbi:MAG: prolyl oligopeptidase family serine peptidase [Phycisphaerales bacterium]|nr:prolyl oligopeptidase family serine peptidase [Phycisphaerales bacterium]